MFVGKFIFVVGAVFSPIGHNAILILGSRETALRQDIVADYAQLLFFILWKTMGNRGTGKL